MVMKKKISIKTDPENERQAKQELQQIPGVGIKLARDLYDLGCRKVSDLGSKDPDDMYQALCDLKGRQIDRCVLYVFRCAVYFADNTTYDQELLKWWNWKD